VGRPELIRRLGQGQLQHPIPERLGQLGRLARPRQVLQAGQAVLGVAAAPGDHRALGATDQRGNFCTGYLICGQQHDPGPLDHPGRRALVPSTSLQLTPIGVGNLHHPHMRGHEKWSPWP
jgi:hypothetical protein